MNAAVSTTTRKILPSILLPSAGVIFSLDHPRSENVSLCERVGIKEHGGMSNNSDDEKTKEGYNKALEKKKGATLSKRVSVFITLNPTLSF